MKTKNNTFAAKTPLKATCGLVLVIGAMPLAMAAEEDDEIRKQTRPTNTVEAGVLYNSADSFKAGEFNGLANEGFYGIGNIDLSGSPDSNSDSTRRWRFKGTNIGLQNRNVTTEYGWQGKLKLNFEYDELQRNRSDSFKTPYIGEGTNDLRLPGSWLVPTIPQVNPEDANARGLSPAVTNSSALANGVLTPPTAAEQGTAKTVQNANLPLFHNVDLYTKRQKYEGGFSYFFTPEWEFTANARHEDRNGAKPMAFNTKAVTGERVAILPDLINQTTDQYNASFNYTGEKAFMQIGYYGSLFYNNIYGMKWQDWGPSAADGSADTPTQTRFDTMSTAPDNQFHQFNLNGGYNFSPRTKFVMGGSYAQSTQNEAFIRDALVVSDPATGETYNPNPLVPVSSLNGLIETSTFNMKLTHKPTNDLGFALGYKYDNRDNKTPVNTFAYYSAGEPPNRNANDAFVNALGVGPLGGNININANTPYSKMSNQITLNGNYHVAKNHWLNAGYEWERLDRGCSGSWYNCVNATKSNEHTGKFQWRSNLTDSINTKVDYAFSTRSVNYDENSWLSMVPMANVVPTDSPNLPNGVPATAYNTMVYYGLTGFGPKLGYPNPNLPQQDPALAFFFANNNALSPALYGNRDRISELLGMRRFNMANRDRHKLRTAVNWQPTDRLSIQGGFDFSNDDYPDSTYGLQKSRQWDFNLDVSYAFSDSFNANIFYSHQNQLSNTAGRTYTANSSAANVNGATRLSGNGSCNNFTTLEERNLNYKIDPCLNWTTDMQNDVDVLGLSLMKNGLLSGKLSLTGDFVVSLARTNVGVFGGNYANNPLAAPGGIAAYYIPATNLPEVQTNTYDLRLTAQYAIDKASSIRAMYSFMHMNSSDYAYQGMQPGSVNAVLPTYETSPNYSVHAFGLAYNYSFQ
ncbi:MAG: MtrB/PioB family decaheme-associated outer membrane protein [Methyloglobulus sp.]|nr:MtrB/PioB family decaheme-associated outer membrane protein [Methyloglobulus sp.]